jgi:hypothetical protein
VRERVGHYDALRPALDRVVTDRRRRADRLLGIARFDQSFLLCVVRPDAGVAIGLQFEGYGQPVILSGSLNAVHGAENILDVVTDLMRDDIGLCKITRRLKLPLQLLEEIEIEI